jgi:phosphoribosylglycinamide formyltransferase-1
MYSVGVFASGGGSNFKAIADKVSEHGLDIEFKFLLTNNSKCGAIDKAEALTVPTHHVSTKTHPNESERDQAILSIVKESKIDLLILAGYMKKIPDAVLALLPNKIINIHPALLPSFGGKGHYGMNVHTAVLEYGAKVSGATVHFVNEEYDCGKIIKQGVVDIANDETPESLAQKVLAVEHEIYWQVVAAFSKKQIEIIDEKVHYFGK